MLADLCRRTTSCRRSRGSSSPTTRSSASPRRSTTRRAARSRSGPVGRRQRHHQPRDEQEIPLDHLRRGVPERRQGPLQCQFTFACDGRSDMGTERRAWNRAAKLAEAAFREFQQGERPGVVPELGAVLPHHRRWRRNGRTPSTASPRSARTSSTRRTERRRPTPGSTCARLLSPRAASHCGVRTSRKLPLRTAPAACCGRGVVGARAIGPGRGADRAARGSSSPRHRDAAPPGRSSGRCRIGASSSSPTSAASSSRRVARDVDALADAVGAAGPAGIEQPDLGAARAQPLCQQLAVDLRDGAA